MRVAVGITSSCFRAAHERSMRNVRSVGPEPTFVATMTSSLRSSRPSLKFLLKMKRRISETGINKRAFIFFLCDLGVVATLFCFQLPASAQSGDMLSDAPVPKEYLNAFESLLDEKFPNPAVSRDLLCRKYPDEFTSRPADFKSAFIKSEVDLTASIVFTSKQVPKDSFTFDTHFQRNGLLVIKHSKPRRAVDYDGFKVLPARDWLRYILYRGSGGTDLVVIAPSLQDCTTRGIVMCPRVLSMGGMTKPSDYVPNSISVSGHAEAEGIFGVDAGENATTTVEVKATRGIPLPERRAQSTTATSAIETLKFDFPLPGEDKPLIPLDRLPSISVLETFVRFTKATRDAFEYSSRSEITISPFELKPTRKATTEEGILYVSAGPCFILMKRMVTGGRSFKTEEIALPNTPTPPPAPTESSNDLEIDPFN